MLTANTVQLEEATLANGARVVLNALSESPRLAIDFFLPGGTSFEPATGLSDMVDRLLLKGTATRDQEAIAEAIDDLSLDLDTDATRDYAMIGATMLDEDLDASLALIADSFYHASLAEFEREMQRAAGEWLMDLDVPRARASDLFYRTLFDQTPYGVTTSVLLENLPALPSVEAVRAFYHGVFHPARMLVSVSGNIAMARIAQALERHFPPVPQAEPLAMCSPAAARLQAHRLHAPRTVGYARDDASQIHLLKGWLAPALTDPDYYPMMVLHTLLGGAGLTSRLFVELRDRQGLAYQVRSAYDAFSHQGLFVMYIGADPQNRDRCLEGFRVECQKLIDTPVSAKELADTLENILGRRAVYLETTGQQANYIGSNLMMGRHIADLAQVNERLRAVGPADIQRMAQRVFSQPAVIAMAGPSQTIAPLLDSPLPAPPCQA